MGASSGRRRIVASMAGFEGSLALVGLGLGWLVGQPVLERWTWSWLQWLAGVAAAVPMLLLFILSMRLPAGPLARINRFCMEVVRPMFEVCSWYELAFISLMAGIGEEVLFRDCIQDALSEWLGPWAGLLLASVLFGLMHPFTPTYIVAATGIGLYLGLLYEVTDSIVPPIVAHAVYDFIALVYLVRRHENMDPAAEKGGEAF